MNSNLKQKIWEAHPYMPRVNKLKLVKYIPAAVDRLVACCKLIGRPDPSTCDPTKCSIDDDMLTLRDSQSVVLGRFYVGTETRKLNLLVLEGGTHITEHEFNAMRGELAGCQCFDCHSKRDKLVSQEAEKQIDVFAARSISIHTPKEHKVNSVSPEVLARINVTYQP